MKRLFPAVLILFLVTVLSIPSYAEQDIIIFGTYEQDNDTSDGLEPISWRVLKRENDMALVISCDALDCQPYHQEFTDITWENCTLRSWLNDNFLYRAFTDDELSRIQTVTVTEAPLPETETPVTETENPYVEAQEQGRQKLVDLYAQLLEDQIGVVGEAPHYGAQVVVALFKNRTTDRPDISWHAPNDENHMECLPQERLAKVLEEADTAILVYPEYTWVGNYTTGGAANSTTTEVAVIDLHQEKRFNIYDVATTDPPQTIYAAFGTGASGEMKIEDAMRYIADQLNAQSPEDYTPKEYGDISADQILDALGNDVFRSTYEAVSQGEEIVNGTQSDAAKGLQETLNEFGRNLVADGAAGNMTFEGLHQVQEALGLERTESVNADIYLLLLKYLLLDTDEAMAAAALGITDSSEAAYQHANVLKLKGQGYLARLKYEESAWGDWEEKAAGCIVSWPENGKVYQNQNIQGSDVELVVHRNGDEGTAMQVDICTLENEVISSLFISGSGEATVYLPSGTFMIRSMNGNEWYGPEAAFGGEHPWSIMTFNSDEDSSEQVPYVNLPSGSWMITINAAEYDPDSESIGSMSMEEYLEWVSQN